MITQQEIEDLFHNLRSAELALARVKIEIYDRRLEGSKEFLAGEFSCALAHLQAALERVSPPSAS